MNNKIKIVSAFLCGAVFFSGVSYAAESLKAIPKSFKFVVNGVEKKLTNTPVVINNTTYLPVREVANSLGYSVNLQRDTISFNTSSGTTGNVDSSSLYDYEKTKLGGIKGTITWQYNKFIGTKADVGANIALIPVIHNDKLRDSLFTLTLSSIPQGTDGIYTGKADGNGNYIIEDIPAGMYYLLIVSKNTTSDGTIYDYDKELLQSIFAGDSWTQLESKLKFYKYNLKLVTIKENKIITESNDFGYSYF
ncbi:hypothetical protein AWM70_04840 [Paenibacillus yonginensis]|uniref:Copper amine oxidase-like N-terminal domain-containing protein n=1 Tax=Paenibacillus yonginensis TaxID=1462996 RepID=A0A1B1MXU7_9BACL|nr:stalk domain-containing protein [Paenibacillus yonginensis]ANS73979.1 hypothetical protein AWM70_04840 [Paenibacillus yonginensis]